MLQLFPFNSPILVGPDFYETLAEEPCISEETSNHAIMVCAYHRFVAADAKMTQVYKQALKATKGIRDENTSYDIQDISKVILESQRAWVTYRENLCIAEGALIGSGGSRAVSEFSCLADEADRRTEQLQRFAL